MTKTAMIETIQKKATALWTDLKMKQMLMVYKYPEHGGFAAEKAMQEEPTVQRALNQWYVVDMLCQELGIGYETNAEAFEYQEAVYRYFYK